MPNFDSLRSRRLYFEGVDSIRRGLVDDVSFEGIDDQTLVKRYLGRVGGPGLVSSDVGIPGWRNIIDNPTASQDLARLLKNQGLFDPVIMPGGEPTVHGEHPETVAISRSSGSNRRRERGTGRISGSGVAISPNVVLTATHVVQNDALDRRRNPFLINEGINMGEGKESSTEILKIVRAPRRNGHEVDLAILFLKDKSTGKPKRLASRQEIEAGRDWWAAGFGSSDFAGTQGIGTKRKGKLTLQFSGLCQPDEAREYDCTPGIHLVIGQLGENLEDRVDTCAADSGGPLFVETPGEGDVESRLALAGITNKGRGGGVLRCGQGGLYVRLDLFHGWIKDEIDEVDGAIHPEYPA